MPCDKREACLVCKIRDTILLQMYFIAFYFLDNEKRRKSNTISLSPPDDQG